VSDAKIVSMRKQRLRYRSADPDAWPIDVGVYGELVENKREIEREAKLLVHIGVDAWLRGEDPTHPAPRTRSFGLGPAAYAGPAVMINFGKLWWAVGAYARVTDVPHDLQPGEPYGPLYVRSMIGYEL